MAARTSDTRLSQISTCWSVVCRAHQGADTDAARQALLNRYGGVVARYLHGALRDPSAAEELYQEFALRLLRGDFRRAAPQYGRFRDFLKTSLVRLVNRHGTRRQSGPRPLEFDVADSAPNSPAGVEKDFVESWRSELLAGAWQALQRFEEETGRPFYRVLRLRVERPGDSSEELAACFSQQLGKPLTPAGIRQTLHRARQEFAELLLDQVVQSLAEPTPDEIDQELADLRLLEYCRPALAQLRNAPPRAPQP